MKCGKKWEEGTMMLENCYIMVPYEMHSSIMSTGWIFNLKKKRWNVTKKKKKHEKYIALQKPHTSNDTHSIPPHIKLYKNITYKGNHQITLRFAPHF